MAEPNILRRRRTDQDDLLGRPRLPRTDVPPPRKRRRRRGSYWRSIGAAALIVLALYVGAKVLLQADRIRPLVEDAIRESLDRPVRISSLKFSIGLGTLIAEGVVVAEDRAFSRSPFMRAQRLELGIGRLALILHRRVEINSIYLENPVISVFKNSKGQWNTTGILAATSRLPLGAGPRFRIRGGALSIRTGDNAPWVLKELAAETAHLSPAAHCVFSLSAVVDGGGTLKLNGKAGPVEWEGGAAKIPLSALVNAKKVDLAKSGLTDSISTALGGLLSFDGSVESDGKIVQAGGNAQIAKLKLARQAVASDESLSFVFDLRHDLEARAGALRRCELQVGKGSVGITGRYAETDGRMTAKLQAFGRAASVTPLAPLLAAASVQLPAGASLAGGLTYFDLILDGPLEGPTTTGSITVNYTRLMGFDLQERLSAVTGLETVRTGPELEINSLVAKISAGPGKISVDSLEAYLPEVGTLRGSGEIRDDRTLEFRMSATRRDAPDKAPVPFFVRGPSIAPVFRQPGKTN